MSRVTRAVKVVQKELKKKNQKPVLDEELEDIEGLDVSSIEKASFLQGEQYSSHGNPLHSTALEDNCSPELSSHPQATAGGKEIERGQKKKPDVTETPKRPARVNKVQAKSKQKGEIQSQQKSSESEANQKPAQKSKSRCLQTIPENRGAEGKKGAQSEVSEAPTSESAKPGAASGAAPAQSQRRPSLSSEEVTDEDESFHPSKKKSKSPEGRQSGTRTSGQQQKGQKQKRKSSSGSSDGGNLRKKQKRGTVKSPIDLDIVLEAFQDFVTQYKETVNSDSVKQAIDALSRSFEEQLSEMITATREFNDVKRKAVKINNTLNHKKTRLLEAKNELIKDGSITYKQMKRKKSGKRSEDDVRRLQKEHDELQQRLKALRQSTTFLTNLKKLNQQYLDYRIAHPDEPETYGPSCMPAMLLEARSITGTATQLKNINNKLQQILEKNQ